jgi:hypothetical protein
MEKDLKSFPYMYQARYPVLVPVANPKSPVEDPQSKYYLDIL